MILSKTGSFYQWFIDWYKTILSEVTIMISVPNEIQPYIQDDVIILDCLKGTTDSIDLSPFLKTLLQKADEHGLTIYLDPTPSGKDNNTREFYVSLYQNHGFEFGSSQQFMSRTPITIKS